MPASQPPQSQPYDVVVLGAGPGGYSAAIRAAQLGKSAAVVERDKVGGVCLNWGCIPTKALIRNAEVLGLVRRAGEFGIKVGGIEADFGAAVDRSRRVAGKLAKGVEYLLKKNKVTLIPGSGRFLGPRDIAVVGADGAQTAVLRAQHVIIATGSHAKSLPGVEVDGRRVITSTEAMLLRELPESMIILGGGAVGVEFAYVFSMYGVQVTIVEMLPHILPGVDEEISTGLERSFAKRKIVLRSGWKVEGATVEAAAARVRVSKAGQMDELRADVVLMAVGRGGNTEGLGLEAAGVAVERGVIAVDGFCRASVPHIYAVGDVNGPPLLAHAAAAEGVLAAEHLAGTSPRPRDPARAPSCVYCQPQVASLGLTEAQAAAEGRAVKIGRYPFMANGRAQAEGDYEGLVKLIADAASGALLGAHILGHSAAELINEINGFSTLEAPVARLGHTIHAHPTYAESLMEAALSITGEAINI